MQRRKFLRNTGLASLGASIFSPLSLIAQEKNSTNNKNTKYKNVIFMVSDGMSIGTLSMSNILHNKKHQSSCNWIKLYENNIAFKALMDTSSANSVVTDSAAASSAWGGGRKVNNGSLNYNTEEQTVNKPILRKMKDAGKAIGCVTTVPITHATPAGFCIATKSRNDQEFIAELYLGLEPDVMLGGGAQYFDARKRKDKKDMYALFKEKNYYITTNKQTLAQYNTKDNKRIIGTFASDALPYSIDHQNDTALVENTPTLSEMTQVALNKLSSNKNGFMLQIEAGKVDWAAHANDISALLYDQLEFDKTIGVAYEFTKQHPDTLLIITTDHGNANPGVFYGKDATLHFERLLQFKRSTDWILNKLHKSMNVAEVQALFLQHTGLSVETADAQTILDAYSNLSDEGIYNYKKLPYKFTSEVIGKYTNTKFADMDHSGDHVELCFVGKDLPSIPAFIQNNHLHQLILDLT